MLILCDPVLAIWLTSNRIETAFGRCHSMRLKARVDLSIGWSWPIVPDAYVDLLNRKTKRPHA